MLRNAGRAVKLTRRKGSVLVLQASVGCSPCSPCLRGCLFVWRNRHHGGTENTERFPRLGRRFALVDGTVYSLTKRSPSEVIIMRVIKVTSSSTSLLLLLLFALGLLTTPFWRAGAQQQNNQQRPRRVANEQKQNQGTT